MMTRRSFLAGVFAAGVAPAIVRAESIMRVKAIVLPGDPEFVEDDPIIALIRRTNPMLRDLDGQRAYLTNPKVLQVVRSGLPSAFWQRLAA